MQQARGARPQEHLLVLRFKRSAPEDSRVQKIVKLAVPRLRDAGLLVPIDWHLGELGRLPVDALEIHLSLHAEWPRQEARR